MDEVGKTNQDYVGALDSVIPTIIIVACSTILIIAFIVILFHTCTK